MGTKSPTKWDAQPTESNFQTRSREWFLFHCPRRHGLILSVSRFVVRLLIVH
ncbi:DUF6783 domain-containing protein [Enterocloster hominis (ex Hitch et al. 2024)]|uniref:DUF6783 domain-containing protein n=1 Tax=Enterocloster hominis (ex Hitch et al. 2024) TaxID=1917870 RepID=UPI003F4ECCF1